MKLHKHLRKKTNNKYTFSDSETESECFFCSIDGRVLGEAVGQAV